MKEILRGSWKDDTCNAGGFCTTHCRGKCYHPDNETRQKNVKQLQIALGFPEENHQLPSRCPDGTSGCLCKFKH